MTADEYIAQVRLAATDEAAYAVTRQASADAVAKRLTVDEWNSVWLAYDKRSRPWRHEEKNWTGD